MGSQKRSRHPGTTSFRNGGRHHLGILGGIDQNPHVARKLSETHPLAFSLALSLDSSSEATGLRQSRAGWGQGNEYSQFYPFRLKHCFRLMRKDIPLPS